MAFNSLAIAKPAKVAEYWAIQRQETHTLDEAKKVFLETFDIPKNEQQILIDVIVDVYKK